MSLTDRALTLSVGRAPSSAAPAVRSATASTERVIAWDRAGRLYSVWRDDRTFRRGLGGRVLQKWREAGETRRAWLAGLDADALVDEAAGHAAAAHHSARDDETAAALRRAAAFDAAAACDDAARFARIYSDIGVLPPDQYLAVLVQATEGCSFRSCEFCDLFDRPYRVKTLEEFHAHVTDVREYMGDSLRLRGRSAFLGAANALALPTSRLESCFASIRGSFGESTPIGGFVDGLTGAVKSAADYRRLRDAGLRRVYVGLESGHDPLLAFVRKPSRAVETIEAVRAMKEAGLRVAVVVMPGLGGDRFARGHVADTVRVLNDMSLSAGDLIYFSDLVTPPGGRYAELARDAHLVPLDRAARSAQKQQIRAGLRFAGAPAQIATYDIREFVY